MTSRIGRLRNTWISLLQSRLFLPVSAVLFLVVFCIASLFVYLNTRTIRDRSKRDFNRQQYVLIRETAAQVNSSFGEIRSEVSGLTHLATTLDKQTLRRELAETLKRLDVKSVVQVGLIDRAGHVVTVTDSLQLPPAGSLPAFTPEALGTLVNVPLVGGGSVVVGTIGPRAQVEPGVDAIAFARVNITMFLQKLLGNLHPLGEGYAWAVDTTGHFLYHPINQRVGRSVFTVSTEYNSPPKKAFRDSLLIQRILNGSPGSGEYTLLKSQEGNIPEARLIAFAPLQSHAFGGARFGSAVLLTPVDAVTQRFEKLYVRHYIAGGALLAGLFLFGLLIAFYQQRTSRRLRVLVGEQDQIISSILANSVDAIIVIDDEELVQMWNRGAELIFGYTPGEMLGQPLTRLFPPDIDPKEELRFLREEVKRRGYVRNYTTQRITRDGRRITVDVSRTPFQAPDGSLTGSTAVVKDVTEKTEMDQRMYNAEKLASIGLLASGVAHEINNPLAIVLGFTDLLKERFPEGTSERKDLEMIEYNANQARKIVKDLLGFSRVTEGRETVTDISESVRMLTDFIENTRLTRNVDLMVDVEEGLPTIRGDRRELQQVLLNLINNAVAAIAGSNGRIRVNAHRENGWVVIEVEDNGSGIPEEDQLRIFDPFFTTKEVGEGTGLGLSLSYGIVKKWGGDITFSSRTAGESTDGSSGSTFTVRLPVLRPEDGEKA